MLDILQKQVDLLASSGGYKYFRMDGNTNIKTRQQLVDSFNNDASIDVFLLVCGSDLISVDDSCRRIGHQSYRC
jgi:hypothetical protein